jgi:hypothetical protein
MCLTGTKKNYGVSTSYFPYHNNSTIFPALNKKICRFQVPSFEEKRSWYLFIGGDF